MAEHEFNTNVDDDNLYSILESITKLLTYYKYFAYSIVIKLHAMIVFSQSQGTCRKKFVLK